MHGRAGGIGSGDQKMGLASLDVGGRLYLTSGELAPFVGAGLGLSYFQIHREGEPSPDGSGFGAFGEVGVELLRTHSVAMGAFLRGDAPFYSLEAAHVKTYVVPVSLNLALLFH
jgi:hypothetical protein